MAKILVAYFSASGVTAKAAVRLAKLAGADLFEIKPAVPYTRADLNWMDKKSRSTLEMKDPGSRPEISERVDNMAQYDKVLVGFPIWWYTAPSIIKTFLESYDFAGKEIALFATSGGSGFGKTAQDLEPCLGGDGIIVSEKLMNQVSDEELSLWVKEI